MALKSTIVKVQLQIADTDRHYYQSHSLTLALHPSETHERLMVRVLAFALNASASLAFAKGLSGDSDHAELWDCNLSGEVDLWVEFGQSDEKWLRKACGRARQVRVYTYGGRSVPIWWRQNQAALARYSNLQIWEIPEASVKAMAALVGRTMALQCNIGEGQVWLSNEAETLVVEPVLLKDYT